MGLPLTMSAFGGKDRQSAVQFACKLVRGVTVMAHSLWRVAALWLVRRTGTLVGVPVAVALVAGVWA